MYEKQYLKITVSLESIKKGGHKRLVQVWLKDFLACH